MGHSNKLPEGWNGSSTTSQRFLEGCYLALGREVFSLKCAKKNVWKHFDHQMEVAVACQLLLRGSLKVVIQHWEEQYIHCGLQPSDIVNAKQNVWKRCDRQMEVAVARQLLLSGSLKVVIQHREEKYFHCGLQTIFMESSTFFSMLPFKMKLSVY